MFVQCHKGNASSSGYGRLAPAAIQTHFESPKGARRNVAGKPKPLEACFPYRVPLHGEEQPNVRHSPSWSDADAVQQLKRPLYQWRLRLASRHVFCFRSRRSIFSATTSMATTGSCAVCSATKSFPGISYLTFTR